MRTKADAVRTSEPSTVAFFEPCQHIFASYVAIAVADAALGQSSTHVKTIAPPEAMVRQTVVPPKQITTVPVKLTPPPPAPSRQRDVDYAIYSYDAQNHLEQSYIHHPNGTFDLII